MNIKIKLSILISSILSLSSTFAATHILQNNDTYSGCIDSYASSKWTVENDADRPYISIEN